MPLRHTSRARLLLGLLSAALLWPLCPAPLRALTRDDSKTVDLEDLSTTDLPRLGIAEPQGEVGRVMVEALRLLNAADYDGAIDKAMAILRQRPDTAAAHELLGAALVKKGQIEEGLRSLKKAVEVNPKQSTALTKIGDVYLFRKQDADAKRYFGLALEAAPDDARAHQRMGLMLEAEGQTDQAIQHFEKGLPGTPPAYVGIKVNLANLYNQKREFVRSVELLKAVVTPESPHASACLTLGTAYLALNRVDEAIGLFQRVAALEPDTERGPLGLGIAYRQKGQWEDSLRELQKVLAVKPDWSTAHYQLAETLLGLGKADKALSHLEQAAKLSEAPAMIERRMADVHVAGRQFRKAIALYEKVLATAGDKADMELYFALGTAHQLDGQLDRAEKIFRTACKKFPRSPLPLYRLGVFLGYARQYGPAVDTLKQAAALAPKDPAVLKALSLAHNQQGDRARAIESARQIVELVPDSAADVFYLAALHEDAGEAERAVKLYRRVLALEADHVLALNNLAMLLARAGSAEEAVALARKAASLAPKQGAILDTYGWILHLQGKTQDALKMLENAAALSPSSPTVHYHLGAALFKTGQMKPAGEHFTKALGLSSTFPDHAECLRLKQMADSVTP